MRWRNGNAGGGTLEIRGRRFERSNGEAAPSGRKDNSRRTAAGLADAITLGWDRPVGQVGPAAVGGVTRRAVRCRPQVRRLVRGTAMRSPGHHRVDGKDQRQDGAERSEQRRTAHGEITFLRP